MVLVRADKRVDLKLVGELEGKKVRLAMPEEVLKETGCEVGSVPPFGFSKRLKTYLDREILEEEKVTFNAGLHNVSVVMRGSDLPKVVEPVLF
jgi:Ala-tRNA(Pro) deacylase